MQKRDAQHMFLQHRGAHADKFDVSEGDETKHFFSGKPRFSFLVKTGEAFSESADG